MVHRPSRHRHSWQAYSDDNQDDRIRLAALDEASSNQARARTEETCNSRTMIMYGTTCLNSLILIYYRYSCELCLTWIYLCVCCRKSSVFRLFVEQLSVHFVPCCPAFWQNALKVVQLINETQWTYDSKQWDGSMSGTNCMIIINCSTF